MPKKAQLFEYSDILKNYDEITMLKNKFKFLSKEFNNKKQISLKLLYKASEDSDKSEIFHKKCNGIKNTIVFVENDKEKRFGGFTTQTWDGNGISKKDDNAFIFSLDNLKIYDIIKGRNAIQCHPEYSPIFMEKQILIYNNFFTNGGRTNKTGQNYNIKGGYELTGGYDKFGIKEIEVFHVFFE